jgi:hypothetical protein
LKTHVEKGRKVGLMKSIHPVADELRDYDVPKKQKAREHPEPT